MSTTRNRLLLRRLAVAIVVTGSVVLPVSAHADAMPGAGSSEAVDSTCPATTSDPVGEFPNPLHRCTTADPGIFRVGTDTWYSFSTGGQPDTGVFPIRKSVDDRRTWTEAGYIFPAGQAPDWTMEPNFPSQYWAPQVTRIGDQYVAYYSAQGGALIALGVATADHLEGPWTDRGPIIRGAGISLIDPYPFRDPQDGTNYLLFKYNITSRDPLGRTSIVIRELNPDGLSSKNDATDHVLIRNAPLSWEGRVVEAPSMEFRNGMYYLFYSGNNFRPAPDEPSRYAVGVARSDQVTGGFTKSPDNPILRGDGRFKDPGGQDVVRRPGPDEWMMFYHADPLFAPFDNGRARYLMMDTVSWDSEGWPHVNDGTPSD